MHKRPMPKMELPQTDGEIFPCTTCGVYFTTQKRCNAHVMAVHKRFEQMDCDVCQLTCQGPGELKNHRLKVHGLETKDDREARFPCNECGKAFKHQSNLIRHRKSVHENLKQFACEQCEMRFSRRDVLQNHIKSQHEGKPKEDSIDKLISDVFHQVAGKFGDLELPKSQPNILDDEHEIEHVGEESFELEQDKDLEKTPTSGDKEEIQENDSFAGQQTVETNDKIEDEGSDKEEQVENTKEQNDSDTFEDTDDMEPLVFLETSMDEDGKDHFDEENEGDDQYNPLNLVEATMEDEPVPGPSDLANVIYFTCKNCGHKEHDESKCLYSVNFTTREFVCEQCCFGNMSTPKKNSRDTSHIPNTSITHTTSKSKKTSGVYGCQKCGKGFGTRSHLIRHLTEVHKEEKQELCKHCDAVLPNSEALQKHMQDFHCKQMGEFYQKNPKKCPYCGKWFSRLKRHVDSIHLKKKSHVCQLCNMAFARPDVLKNHIKWKHGIICNIASFNTPMQHSTLQNEASTSNSRVAMLAKIAKTNMARRKSAAPKKVVKRHKIETELLEKEQLSLEYPGINEEKLDYDGIPNEKSLDAPKTDVKRHNIETKHLENQPISSEYPAIKDEKLDNAYKKSQDGPELKFDYGVSNEASNEIPSDNIEPKTENDSDSTQEASNVIFPDEIKEEEDYIEDENGHIKIEQEESFE